MKSNFKKFLNNKEELRFDRKGRLQERETQSLSKKDLLREEHQLLPVESCRNSTWLLDIDKSEEHGWNAKKLPNPYERGRFFYEGKAAKHAQAWNSRTSGTP